MSAAATPGTTLSNNTVSLVVGGVPKDQFPGVVQLVVPALLFQMFWAWAGVTARRAQARATMGRSFAEKRGRPSWYARQSLGQSDATKFCMEEWGLSGVMVFMV